ncbi:hypothetical protein [Paenibacillus agaridevorans]|uniref:hypothetical protein n=1 Tax=Paenibacillus agaridevorans TaxID=171404 RepID=UPI001BE40B25|nr:hypothetical protein [Paenibacillus agaridevorans]
MGGTVAYSRLIVLVLLFEVFITALIVAGYYYGFTVYPYVSSSSSVSLIGGGAAGWETRTESFHATLPLYMPSLQDLKAGYTSLQSGEPQWGAASVLVSAAVLVLQSLVRGMFLGGARGWVVDRKAVPLWANGRRYFSEMLAWSILQLLAGVLMLFLTAVFFPLGLLLLVVMMIYSITPYLMVLQDLSLGDAITKAPGMFRRYFGAMLPLALIAMLCTFAISLTRMMPAPYGYAVPLLLHSSIGTLLILALMFTLASNLKKDGDSIPRLQPVVTSHNRLIAIIHVLLIPALVAGGVYASSGKHLTLFDSARKPTYEGILSRSNFADVFYASEQRYTAYEWRSENYKLNMKLPELGNGRQPDELRGIADIAWEIDEEVRTTSGNTTSIWVEPMERKSRILYRLVRHGSNDGSVYYSSDNGYAAILPGDEKPREPLSVRIFVDGNGENVFVLKYSARLESSALNRVSADGRFLIPGTSPLNPMDVHSYWFAKHHEPDAIFDMLAAKNLESYMPTLNRSQIALAVALQEGDGRMVIDLLDMLQNHEIQVKRPDWDAEEWTAQLRDLYKGAEVGTLLQYLTKAGEQFGYAELQDSESSNEAVDVFRMDVPFPNGNILITYSLSKEDGLMKSVSLYE